MRSVRGVVLAALLCWTALACSATRPAQAQDKDPPKGLTLDHFREVIREAESRHVDGPTRNTLIRGAIDGALRSLDPWSTYMDKSDLKRLRNRMRGTYSGIGVEIAVKDGNLTIIAPVGNSPAARAGIKPGDIVLAIDGAETRGWSTRDSSEKLLGKAGTQVDVTVRSPGVPKSKRTVTITRAKIIIQPATVTLVGQEGLGGKEGKRIAHVKLEAFQRNTREELAEALEAHKPLQGIILDVRGNPGGLLTAAVGASALFLEDGPVVETVGRNGTVLRRFLAEKAHDGHEWLRSPDLPMVVLIDKGSASASEIVAGALQDRRRAVLIGERSFGKGSVQSLVDLDHGAALKLTTARYRLPAGRIIDGVGLVPELRATGEDALALALDVIRSWKRLRGD